MSADPAAHGSVALGLDLGTSSAKVCALDERDRVLGIQSEPYPSIVPQPAWAEQDPALWLPAIARACRRLMQGCGLVPEQVRGLAVSSAAHIGVMLDAAGQPLRPALLWHDQRSQAESRRLSDAAGDEIFAIGNNWPTPTWTLAHLAWIRAHDAQAWSKMRHLLLSKDYLGYQLTGQMASDPAAAVSALLFDVHTGDWSQRLCDLAGIERSRLAPVLPVGAQIGSLLAEPAALLGLASGTPVYNGTMDSTAETLSAGVRTEGECVIRLASAGGIHGISSPARVHPKLISYPYPVAPYWMSQAGTNTCASAVAWACSLMTGDSTDGGAGGASAGSADLGDAPDFVAWSALAEQAPAGSNGLFFHPYLAGERCPYWDPDLRASFVGLGLHHRRSDLARAVYEGTAYSLRDALSVMQGAGFRLGKVRLLGGGAKSRIWTEIVSAVLNTPVQAAPLADSSVGAALLAQIGMQLHRSAADIPADIASAGSRQFSPPAGLVEQYALGFERYCKIQQQLAGVYQTD
jgi:xylulokinase